MEDNEAAIASTSTTPTNNSDTTANLWAIESELDSLDAMDVAAMTNTELVRLREAIKAVEKVSESVRKDVADAELKERVAPGESLLGISHIESHRKYLAEDETSVVMRAVAKGINFHDFVSVNASTLAKEYPDLAEVGEQEYSYLR
ncbi:hypothetical protein M199_gp069 [Halogranum tailed virus 1]|uniref:Uncharacterized protein n=1 Tax=Halogranum tailed virus 1 TaxID=1273749 RepID=R4TLL4_9CAUD|nr:hypothetical protein M199_gp069 [Halogranum tailed virus 1]AGM11597.1 hypothetical protein HGTV1_300 [Halogranum tailed virus 1]